MRLFQRVGAVLPGKRRPPLGREAQAPGSAWAAFAQAAGGETTLPAAATAASPPPSEEPNLAEPAPSADATPDLGGSADPDSSPAVPGGVEQEPGSASPEAAELDLMALLPPELRQPIAGVAAEDLPPAPLTSHAATPALPPPDRVPEPGASTDLAEPDAPVLPDAGLEAWGGRAAATFDEPETDLPAPRAAEALAAAPSDLGLPTSEAEPVPQEVLAADAPSREGRLASPEPGFLDDNLAEADPPPFSGRGASRSSLSDLLAEGFRHLDAPDAGAAAFECGPSEPDRPNWLAESLRPFGRPEAVPQPRIPRSLPGDEAEDEPWPKGRATPSPQPGPALGLAAFLADASRHLDEPGPSREGLRPLPEPEPAAAGRRIREAARGPAALPSQPSLAEAAEIAGLIASCLVDSDSGLLLASEGKGLDLDAAAALSTQVVRAERDSIEGLGLDDRIEDILITTRRQLHVIRPVERMPAVFLYLVLERKAANLGMARIQLSRIEGGLAL